MKTKNFFHGFIFIFSILVSSVVLAENVSKDLKNEQVFKQMHGIRVPFVENKGQIKNDDVKFYAKTFSGNVFVDENGFLSYSLPAEDNKLLLLREIFADKKLSIEGLESAPTLVNYFVGNDKNKWQTNIPSYNRISLGEVYDGIEVTLQVQGNTVEKLFNVIPQKDPKQIEIKIDGCEELILNEDGELEAITELGTVKFTKPIAFQEVNDQKKSVDVSYVIKGEKAYSFQVGNYDKTKSLIIDPLIASTFIGGAGDRSTIDAVYSIAIDNSDNIYITGESFFSTNHPTTPGVYNENHNESQDGLNFDVFISKFNPSLNTLLSSTFIGGSRYDKGCSIAFDNEDNVYLTGETNSSDYPTTSGSYDESHNGSLYDVFISKFNPSLNTLLASTFVGSSNQDYVSSIALDSSGNVYVTGQTRYFDFPTTPGAYDESHNDNDYDDYNFWFDIFISKFSPDLNILIASTFCGGSDNDYMRYKGNNEESTSSSIAIDNSGNVYVTGVTESPDFPTTPGAYKECDGSVFISKFNSNLSILLASTLIDDCYKTSIDIDENGNVYLAGNAYSSYPTTPGAYEKKFYGYGVFISKLNSKLNDLLASAFISGSEREVFKSMVLDNSGNVYVTGYTSSINYPTTSGAYDEIGESDDITIDREIFISKFNPSLNTLLASTFIGSSDDDYVSAIALSRCGHVYVAGQTRYSDFPTTPGAYDETFNYGAYTDSNIFVSKLDSKLSKDIIVSDIKANGSDGPITITSNDNLSITIVIYPNGFLGDNADWWLVAVTPFGLYHYQSESNSWAPDLTYSHQGPLFNLGEFEVLNIADLPFGSYTVYFGVDMDMNGILDMDQAYYDSVTVNVQ